MLLMSPLHATILNPGDNNLVPDAFTVLGDPPILDEVHGSFSFNDGTSTGSFGGTYQEFVLVDPLGITCTGCLDFAFQVILDPDSINLVGAMTFGSFRHYSTNVGYLPDSGGPGAVSPNALHRGAGGGGVGFSFNTVATILVPGGSTNFLVIATDAKTYDKRGLAMLHSVHFISADDIESLDGTLTDLLEPTLIPDSVAPEPSAALFLSLGLVGIAVFRKKVR
jgi:hypothetical protein